LFSLFERSYLMFSNQADMFRQRQWSGWKHFLDDFIRRESVRTAWELSKETYDTDFQKFMDRKIAAVLAKPKLAVLGKTTPEVVSRPVPVAAHASPHQLPHGSPGAAASELARQASV
jgi:hypothetical protein